jgi:DsbC/DsbD-like thiol-disulfide interchange protein
MYRTLLILSSVLLSVLSFAGGPITWAFAADQVTDSTARITLTATCEEGWHLYALTLPRDDGPFPTIVRMDLSDHYVPAGGVIEPQPVEMEDPNFQMLVRYHTATSTFIVPMRRTSTKAVNVEGEVEYMCCNDKMCLPPVTVKFSVPLPAVK